MLTVLKAHSPAALLQLLRCTLEALRHAGTRRRQARRVAVVLYGCTAHGSTNPLKSPLTCRCPEHWFGQITKGQERITLTVPMEGGQGGAAGTISSGANYPGYRFGGSAAAGNQVGDQSSSSAGGKGESWIASRFRCLTGMDTSKHMQRIERDLPAFD